MKTRTIRMISALAALMMCAATGCGSIEEAAPAPAKAAEASEEITETTEEPAATAIVYDEAGDAQLTAETAETAAEVTAFPEDGSFLNETNSMMIGDEGTYDKEKIARMTALVLRQYELITSRDKEGYYSSVNIPALLSNEKIFTVLTGSGEEDYSPENELLCGALYLSASALPQEQAALFEEKPEGMSDEEYQKKLEEAIKATRKKVSPESVTMLFDDEMPFNMLYGADKEYFMPENFGSDPESLRILPNKDNIYMITVDEYTANERGTSAEIVVSVLQGDWQYSLEALVWLSDKGETSVVISDITIEKNAFKGLSLEECKASVVSLSRIKTLNANAKTGYNIAAEYIYDMEIEGKSLKEVLESGDFKLANSAEGLDLSDSSAEHGKGDERFCEILTDLGESAGTIYLGTMKEQDGEGDTFFIQYKDGSGAIGQYPECITPENVGKPVWGTFFTNYPAEEEKTASEE